MILDATVVSIFEKDIIHKIPGLYPGDFLIPAATRGDISVMNVPKTQFYIDSGIDTPRFPVVQDPSDVSKSIINDVCRAYIEVGPDRRPGIFAIDGWIEKPKDKITVKDIEEYKAKIKELYKPQLEQAKKYQENWARRLVTVADDDWNKFHSHRAISDLHRWAAGYLGLNRDYTSLEKQFETAECPACGLNIRQGVAICFNCKAVLDPEKAKKFGLA